MEVTEMTLWENVLAHYGWQGAALAAVLVVLLCVQLWYYLFAYGRIPGYKNSRRRQVLDAEPPPLRNFVLPGGSRISSRAQICRTVARRCERRVVTLANEHDVDQNVLTYLNRLSDYFFVLARFNNIHNQIEEIFWDKDCK